MARYHAGFLRGPQQPVRSTPAIHLQWTVTRRSQVNKTQLSVPSANPSPLSLISRFFSTLHRERKTRDDRSATDVVGGRRPGPQRHLGPLTGVRTHRWVNAPPSSDVTMASLCTRTDEVASADFLKFSSPSTHR
jgi:hypothetical protein